MIAIRPATQTDVRAIETLLASEIARGSVLPKRVTPETFLVAVESGHLLGIVALTHQSPRVVEVGSLVSTRRGIGLGHRLVEAAVSHASLSGYEVVMALTAISGFFERVGFRVASHAPWITARQQLAMPHPLPLAATSDAVEAAHAKSTTCRLCPRLAACSQALLLRQIPAQHRRHA